MAKQTREDRRRLMLLIFSAFSRFSLRPLRSKAFNRRGRRENHRDRRGNSRFLLPWETRRLAHRRHFSFGVHFFDLPLEMFFNSAAANFHTGSKSAVRSREFFRNQAKLF